MLFQATELDARELEVIEQIDELRQNLRFRLREPRRWTGSLRRNQFARAVQGSNSIEGYEAKLDDAVAIEVGEDALDASRETSLAIRGYRDAMTYVLQLAEEPRFQFGEQLLKSLHFMMTNYDLANRPGRWRASSIFVRDESTGDIVYEGVDVEQVDELMHELVCDLEREDNLPVIVKAAMAHLNLVLIHPFRDGNGRMARCLQSLVLTREGIVSPEFSSIEEYLGKNTRSYYDVLAAVGRGSWQPENDTRAWIRYVLTAHLRQAATILRRSKEIERLYIELDSLIEKRKLPDRTIDALFDAVMGMRVRRSVYKAIIGTQLDEPISDQTATRDLQALVAADLLVPKGEKRGRYYVAGDIVLQIRASTLNRREPRDERDPFSIAASVTDPDQGELF